MASRPDDDEPLELSEELAEDDAPPEDEEEETPPDDDRPDGEEPEGEETLIAFDDEGDEAKEGDSAVIRRIRERNKQLAAENAELRKATPAPVEELRPKPTLADSNFDEDEYEGQLTAWHDRRRKIDDDKTAREAEAEAANREWQRDLESFATSKDQLGVKDFDDASETVKSSLNLVQQAVIIKAAAQPAAFVYALGHSDARLAELAKIQDPIKMAAAVARMEGGVKVTKKRRGAAPDRPASGSGKLPGGADKQLAKLEEEAERTGDRTPVIRYKTKQKARAAK